MPLVLYIARRIAVAVATLLVVLAAVFTAIQSLPGGYVNIVIGARASAERRQAAIEQFGLDQPIPVQFVRWLGAALQGDLGISLVTRQPVVDELANRLPVTVQITIVAVLIAVVFGVALGLASGLSRRRPVLRATTRTVGLMTLSIPDFVTGMVLLLVATVGGWGLTGGYVRFADDPLASLASTLLASITLGLGGIAIVMRTLNDSILATLTEPFITSAVARGERASTIVRRHVIRNSAAPSINVIALLIGLFLGGTVVAEVIFSLPGIGLFFVGSVRARDFAVVQGVVLITASVFIIFNMLAAIVHVLLDPRLATQRGVAK